MMRNKWMRNKIKTILLMKACLESHIIHWPCHFFYDRKLSEKKYFLTDSVDSDETQLGFLWV